MINYNENKTENGKMDHDVNRTRPKYGNKYNKYKMCLSLMMVMCNDGYDGY